MKMPGTCLRGLAAVIGLCVLARADAHHSYVMFDGSRTLTVRGTVAKLEWVNPHIVLWLYVPQPSGSGHDLYAFESGSTNVLARRGWSRDTFKPGDKVSIEYWPLKDGRHGGHFRLATHADGHVTRGAGGPRGDQEDLPPAAGKAPGQ